MNHISLISIDEFKSWCRIDSQAENGVLDMLIASASAEAIIYTGLALSPDFCPIGIKQAVAIRAADLYANREGQTVGTKTFERLLNPFRTSLL